MRQGCKALTQLEIMPKPPMDRAEDNPWPEWPKVYKLDYGQEEAAAKFGQDPRAYLTTVQKFVGDAAGNVTSIVTVEIGWEKNAAGQSIPTERPGSQQTLPADLVLLAMGFTGPEEGLLGPGGRARCPQQRQAEYEQYTTSVKGVFTAGDCRRGQA
jgi:glutamate synthase (NADPH/NADH) small chain